MAGLERHDVPDGVDASDWTLAVGGSVSRRLRLDRSALTALPRESFDEDFACVAGWVAEGLSWRGVRVGALLDRAEPSADGDHALVRAMDGDYACSFPIDRLGDALLAVELDGDPLPVAHGGPARLIPAESDSDCWESIKWVSEIEVVTEPPTADDTAKEIAFRRIEGE